MVDLEGCPERGIAPETFFPMPHARFDAALARTPEKKLSQAKKNRSAFAASSNARSCSRAASSAALELSRIAASSARSASASSSALARSFDAKNLLAYVGAITIMGA